MRSVSSASRRGVRAGCGRIRNGKSLPLPRMACFDDRDISGPGARYGRPVSDDARAWSPGLQADQSCRWRKTDRCCVAPSRSSRSPRSARPRTASTRTIATATARVTRSTRPARATTATARRRTSHCTRRPTAALVRARAAPVASPSLSHTRTLTRARACPRTSGPPPRVRRDMPLGKSVGRRADGGRHGARPRRVLEPRQMRSRQRRVRVRGRLHGRRVPADDVSALSTRFSLYPVAHAAA